MNSFPLGYMQPARYVYYVCISRVYLYLPLYSVCERLSFTLSYCSLTVDFIDGECDDGEKDDKQ